MNLIRLQMKLARSQVGIFILLALLQRSPAMRVLVVLERMLSQPIARIVQAATWTATTMGVFHATAGATQFNTAPGSSPFSTEVGDSFQMSFTVTGAPVDPAYWRIEGSLVPGLSLTSDAGKELTGPFTDGSETYYEIEGKVVGVQGMPTRSDAYVFTAQAFNPQGLTDNNEYEVQINVFGPPEFISYPASTITKTGGRAQFFFDARNTFYSPTGSIQWLKNGVALPGETGTTLIVPDVQPADEGVYSVALTNAYGVSESLGATLTVDDAASSDLVNLSNRGFVGTGGNVMIPGLVISGQAAKTVLVRGVGPHLAKSNVPDVLANPELKLYRLGGSSGPQLLGSNDDWEIGNDVAEITDAMVRTAGSNNVFDKGSKDAAMLVTLNPGVYTFLLSGVGATTGVGLVELFVLD